MTPKISSDRKLFPHTYFTHSLSIYDHCALHYQISNTGSGKQYFSFISARDAARAIVHVIETPSLTGPVNLVAPTTCTNAGFTQALGKILSRPTIVPLPEFAVKLLFGEMGEEMLLGGVKAEPKKLLGSGFKFRHSTIDEGLESAMEENI